MSHTGGTVTFKDNTVMYFEYNGTSDIARPLLFLSRQELSDNWRCPIPQDKWVNSAPDEEEVEIYTDYGDGISWKGTASRSLMVLTGDLIPEEYRDW